MAQAPSYRVRTEMLRSFTEPTAWLDVGAGHGHFCQVARQIWTDTAFDGLDQSVSVEQAQRRGWIHHGYRGELIGLAGELTDRYGMVSMYITLDTPGTVR